MFKKAVDSHGKASKAPTNSQQFFQGNLSASQKARPLSSASGNATKPSIDAMKNANIGVKRSSNGLAKAFSEPPTFADGSKRNPYTIDSASKENKSSALGAELYDDDFDDDLFDDIELDIENPAGKGSVHYPTLSAPPRTSKPVPSSATIKTSTAVKSSATLPRVSSTREASYIHTPPKPQTAAPREPTPPKSSAPIPWSPSPPQHVNSQPQAAAIRKWLQSTVSEVSEDDGDQPRKRRHLPWMGTQDAKNEPDKQYPWDTTAKAMRDMQNKYKKTVKTNSGEGGLIADVAKKQKSKLSKLFLSEEQHHVLDLVLEKKKSVFFTGSAGTGKSVLLREIIAGLKRKYVRDGEQVAVTASTGLAACNIGGITLHSFAGIGLGKEPAEELVKKIKRNQKHKHRWMRCKVLVIDEISMIDGDLFDKLERIARIVRNNGRPFGGIQIVITGDFFQLPPVPERGAVSRFAFEANTWNTVIDHTIGLTHVFRQKDPVFAGMLNEMREGRMSPSSINAFRSLNRPLVLQGLEATELFPLREEVDNANKKRMNSLYGELQIYEARDGGTAGVEQRTKLLSNCMAPQQIQLKKGSQVMLIKNIDDTLVNGSLGKVIGFMNDAMFDKYMDNEEDFVAGAATRDDDPEANMKREQIRRSKMTSLLETGSQQLLPLVRFSLPDGTTRDLLCQRESWKIELPNGEVQASRQQVPLILAWALSIHKAQGQTLEHVKVDLGRVFEKGQAYVALSRATSMQGLQVLNFDPRKVVAHERVREFYANLSRAHVGQDGGIVMKKGAAQPQGKKGAGISAQDYEKGLEDSWANEDPGVAYG